MDDPTDPSLALARREVRQRQEALDRVLEQLSARATKRLDQAQRVSAAARSVAADSARLVSQHRWVFLAASVGAGVAIGRRRPRRLAGPAQPRPPRSSLVVEAGILIGKALLRRFADSLARGDGK
jgi:ElaB/YqjD/DUF883 family membrane-anchored ribosome-binding protein